MNGLIKWIRLKFLNLDMPSAKMLKQFCNLCLDVHNCLKDLKKGAFPFLAGYLIGKSETLSPYPYLITLFLFLSLLFSHRMKLNSRCIIVLPISSTEFHFINQCRRICIWLSKLTKTIVAFSFMAIKSIQASIVCVYESGFDPVLLW